MKRLLVVSLVCFVLLAAALPVLAGGWAVITLEGLPAELHAGAPFSVQFAVRQHGRTLMGDLEPTLTFTNPEGGQMFSFDAAPLKGKTGYYQAEINLPAEGGWRWSIQAFSMDQPMPDLAVGPALAAAGVAAAGSPAPWTGSTLALFGLGGLAILSGLLMAATRRLKWAVGLALAAALLGGAGLVSVSARNTPVKAASQSQPSSAPPERVAASGQELFIAKGCVTCHRHDGIDSRFRPFSTEMGLNLTHYVGKHDFLLSWLKDPEAIKPQTEMPNLELNASEIELLAEFLSTKK